MFSTQGRKMTINDTNVQDLMAKVKKQLEQEEDMTPALKSSIEMLLVIVAILVERLGANTKNSNKPPSKDENRKKESKAKEKTSQVINRAEQEKILSM